MLGTLVGTQVPHSGFNIFGVVGIEISSTQFAILIRMASYGL